jgi:hypothetical protein
MSHKFIHCFSSFSGLYYKLMMIVNDNCRVVNKLEASLTDDPRVILYDCQMFIVQATGLVCLWNKRHRYIFYSLLFRLPLRRHFRFRFPCPSSSFRPSEKLTRFERDNWVPRVYTIKHLLWLKLILYRSKIIKSLQLGISTLV